MTKHPYFDKKQAGMYGKEVTKESEKKSQTLHKLDTFLNLWHKSCYTEHAGSG